MPNFTVHTAASAPEGAKNALTMIEQKYGFIPNLAGVIANSPATLNAFMGLMGAYETPAFTLSPLERQIVLLTVSSFNKCEYCAATHGMIAHKLGLDRTDIENIQHGRPVSDARLEALRAFTAALVEKRGWTGQDIARRFTEAGYTQAQMLEVLVGVALKTLTNYANHIAQPAINEMFAAYRPDWLRAA